MQSDGDGEGFLKKRPRRTPFPFASRKNFTQEEDIRLETTRARCIVFPARPPALCFVFGLAFDSWSVPLHILMILLKTVASVLKRHGELAERLSRDSDKTIYERLQREFDSARASQTQEVCLEGEEWNDGLVAMIREKVHIEADRKAMPAESSMIPDHHFEEKITYRVGNKVICCLEGARIGILYETTFTGEPCELYHCVLESKSFLEKLTVHEHTIPFFLPIRATENEFLSTNTIKFIDHLGEMVQAYVDRREQVRLIKELYGNQIGELYHSLPYHLIEFVLDDVDCKITVSLRYTDLVSVLPSKVRVFAWPINHSKRVELLETYPNPARLSYAEDALRTMSLPEAYAELVLNLPQAAQQIFPVGSPS